MGVIGIDSRDDLHVLWDSGNRAEEVYRGFEGAEEDTCTGQEEVSDGGRLEIERGPGTLAF